MPPIGRVEQIEPIIAHGMLRRIALYNEHVAIACEIIQVEPINRGKLGFVRLAFNLRARPAFTLRSHPHLTCAPNPRSACAPCLVINPHGCLRFQPARMPSDFRFRLRHAL